MRCRASLGLPAEGDLPEEVQAVVVSFALEQWELNDPQGMVVDVSVLFISTHACALAFPQTDDGAYAINNAGFSAAFEVLSWQMDPGDLVVFHRQVMLTLAPKCCMIRATAAILDVACVGLLLCWFAARFCCEPPTNIIICWGALGRCCIRLAETNFHSHVERYPLVGAPAPRSI